MPEINVHFRAHLLIVDTNILWYDQKATVANPEFERFWEEHCNELPISIAIPEVAFQELKVQQNMSGRRAMDKATAALEKVSTVVQTDFKHRVTEKKISEKIDRKFEAWRRKHQATIIKTPYTKISWKTIVENALWRKPPFEEGDRKDRSEKGFRDSAILETIIDHVKEVPNTTSISFVCNDELLRETADKKLKDQQNFSVFDSLNGFESYIRLLREDLTNKFVKRIFRKVRAKFFTMGDENCYYNLFRLREEMDSQSLKFTEDPEKMVNGFRSLFASSVEWHAESAGTYWIGLPIFQEISEGNIYQWRTPINLALFYNPQSHSAVEVVQSPPQKLLLIKFQAAWQVKITATSRFYNPELQSVELLSKSFEVPTEEELDKYQN